MASTYSIKWYENDIETHLVQELGFNCRRVDSVTLSSSPRRTNDASDSIARLPLAHCPLPGAWISSGTVPPVHKPNSEVYYG